MTEAVNFFEWPLSFYEVDAAGRFISIKFLRTPLEKASYLAALLSTRASSGKADTNEYGALRHELLSRPDIADLVPSFVRLNRDLTPFWHFIQPKFKSYQERRTYISEEFTPLLDFWNSANRRGVLRQARLSNSQLKNRASPRPAAVPNR